MVPWFASFFAPLVTALRSLPTLAVTLVLLTWFQAGGTPIAVAFLALFPMLYTGIDKHLLDIGKVYGASAKNKIFRVYLPLSAPYILRESAAALSFSLKLVVSAEVVASTARSLGGLMEDAQGYDLPRLFALVIVTFLVGLFLEVLVGLLTAKVENKSR
jgi:ABC-type nitrate/sulfonate/bicarbonate transport system permease component